MVATRRAVDRRLTGEQRKEHERNTSKIQSETRDPLGEYYVRTGVQGRGG